MLNHDSHLDGPVFSYSLKYYLPMENSMIAHSLDLPALLTHPSPTNPNPLPRSKPSVSISFITS